MRTFKRLLRLAVPALVLPILLGTTAPAADPVRIERDVDYLGAGRSEKGDLYLPAAVAPGQRCPAVVIIHGGGWSGGDKGAAREINIGTTLATHGYVGFSINYVLAGKDRPVWPKNVHDCKTAVRWLRKNADRLHIDPAHLGAIGGSAGGHLAAMLALAGPESGLDPAGPYGEFSCRVQAAVDLYGPADLTAWPPKGASISMFPGSRAEKPELYRLASLASHADKNDPPLLILHGTADTTVDVEQSKALAAALKKAGTPHELVIVPGAPHTFHLQPKQRDLRPLVLGFFDRHLKPATAVAASTAKPPAEPKTTLDKAALDALWSKIYDRPQRLAALDKPAICYLDIQHQEVIRKQLETMAKPLENARASMLRARFKTLSGLDCLVVHESEVSAADLDRPLIKAVLIGGRSKMASRAKDESFFPWIRATKVPMIGFCGGCQLIGSAFKSKTVALRKLRPGETDPNPKYHAGQFKEWGFLPVDVKSKDPLFAGLPERILVREAHAFQMSALPPEFDLLASTAECRIQAVKHRERVLYGVQFHPEGYDDAHPHGQILLKNFFRLALAGTAKQDAAGKQTVR